VEHSPTRDVHPPDGWFCTTQPGKIAARTDLRLNHPRNFTMQGSAHLVRLPLVALTLLHFLCACPDPAHAQTLTNAAQVRALSREEAAKRLPVRLRGIVLGEAEGGGDGFALQDDTAGIYLRTTMGIVNQLKPGDYLEVAGVTDPGEFAPFVQLRTWRKLGVKPVPAPRRVTFEELAAGGLDAQWVEVTGVGRYYETAPNLTRKRRLEIATGNGRLAVRLNLPRPVQPLVDARVRVRGVCYYLVNPNRQVLQPLLAVPQSVPVVIETPAPADPFAAAPRAFSSLLQFTAEGTFGHRVHVRGTVTGRQPDGLLWLRDGHEGLAVRTEQSLGDLQPGDVVDVAGFPLHGDFRPMLEDAVFRRDARGPAPAPVVITAATNAFHHDADLVQIEAVITERQPTVNGIAFTLRTTDEFSFKAFLRRETNTTGTLSAPAQPGARVRLTGICSLVREYRGPYRPGTGLARPDSFHLTLRGPGDLQIIAPPPWWTRQTILWLLVGVAGLSLLATGIVMFLARLRLKAQLQQRRMAEAEFSAILAERNRIAREIHDTLAQGLSAIAMHVELVRDYAAQFPPAAAEHLEQVRDLVRGTLADARSSIWNMRAQVLEDGDLADALGGVLRQLGEGRGLKTELQVNGARRRFAPVTENNLLRIGQEAIANAARHAQAQRLTVTLDFAPREFRLTVRDDGRGLDPNQAPSPRGSFGLMGMRERAAQLGGKLEVESAPGQGTRITLTVPLPQ
jgi:signal transduction histidine kinase